MGLWARLKFLWSGVTTEDIDRALAQAVESGDWITPMWLCDRHLKKNPQAIPVVLARARCYQGMSHPDAFKREVALAYALDDTFVPAIYQQAAVHLEDKEVDKALDMLALIKDHAVVKDGVNSLLGNVCMRRAQARLASEYQLRAWMGNFDGLRYANSYLFGLSYADVDEQTVASEHQFWAQTLQPLEPLSNEQRTAALAGGLRKLSHNSTPTTDVTAKSTQSRIRIGYWGGDYKEHSVRYFFRPLLEAHDRGRFEIFIYDDNFMDGVPDAQTHAMLDHTDHYFGTWRLTDAEVVALIESHQLDVLVDTQGHTSANRLHLWQRRMAPVQITGLAYPPTTGLSGIDFKMIDRHMINPDSSKYYTERPLVLPDSFWCFDPKEDAVYQSIPPFRKNGYLTLGCWGNAAKISPALMQAWAQILKSAPSARLQVVSHSFGERATEDAFVTQMELAGIPLSQLNCRVSFGRDELWSRYGEVDLILDTFPFNGGTTSCWATYAGVPVLTIAGQSLASCMGKSIMSNLGYPQFVVDSLEAYVHKALELIANPAAIAQFRANARDRFKQSPLGNGALFAAAFERAIVDLLRPAENAPPAQDPAPAVPALPLPELLRRAQMLGYYGAHDACDRVLQHCRRHYGHELALSDYESEVALARRSFDRLVELAHEGQLSFTLCHNLALAELAQGRRHQAEEWLKRLPVMGVCNPNQELQYELWQAWRRAESGSFEVDCMQPKPRQGIVHLLVVGRDVAACAARASALGEQLSNAGAPLEVHHCAYTDRVEVLGELIDNCNSDETIVVLRDHVHIGHPDFLGELAVTLQTCDVVSPGGAFRWVQKEWAQDLPEYKAWGLMRPSHLADDLYQLHFAGVTRDEVCTGAVVLDGQCLAFRAGAVKSCALDETLAEAGYWAEEDWVNRLASQGARLSIHRRLGVVIHPSSETSSLHTTTGLPSLLSRLKIDPVALPVDDYTIQTVQVASPREGLAVAGIYLQNRS